LGPQWLAHLCLPFLIRILWSSFGPVGDPSGLLGPPVTRLVPRGIGRGSFDVTGVHLVRWGLIRAAYSSLYPFETYLGPYIVWLMWDLLHSAVALVRLLALIRRARCSFVLPGAHSRMFGLVRPPRSAPRFVWTPWILILLISGSYGSFGLPRCPFVPLAARLSLV